MVPSPPNLRGGANNSEPITESISDQVTSGKMTQRKQINSPNVLIDDL